MPDSRDDCPNEAEDFDGFEDDNGCPDLDNDEDGFVDSRDECPGQPRTSMASRTDGCPNLDNDQDGFLDTVDDCLQQRKTSTLTWTMTAAPTRHRVRSTGSSASRRSPVPPGSARLKRSTYGTLDVIRAMEAYPALLLQIDGHASSDGEAERNLRLSKRGCSLCVTISSTAASAPTVSTPQDMARNARSTTSPRPRADGSTGGGVQLDAGA